MKISPTLRDILLLLILNAALYGVALGAGLFEHLNRWRQISPGSMLIEDKLVLGAAVAGLSGAIFAWRRWADLNREVAQRQQAEVALRSSQTRYQSLVDSLKEVIFQTDAAGLWTFLNPAWTEITGFTLAESLGHNFLDFVHPDDRQHNLELFQPLIERKKEYCRHQIRYLVKAGSEQSQRVGDFCWIEVHARLTLDREGSITGTSGTLRDVTELRQAEEKILHLNTKLEERVQQRTLELLQANEQLAQEIAERQQAQEMLQQRADMEKLVATISTRFIDLPPDELDPHLNWALQIIGEFTGIDRSYIFILSEDRTEINNTHEWCAAEIEPQLPNLQGVPLEQVPWWMAKLTRSETIQVSRVADLPAEAGLEKEILQAQQIRSVLAVPLISAGMLVGCLGFDSVRDEKTWHDADIALLRMMGEIIVSAMERQRAESEIRRRNRELMLLNQIIDASMSALDPEGMLTMACYELVSILNLVQAQAVLFNEAKTEATVVAEAFGATGLSRLNGVLLVNDTPLLRQMLAHKSPLTFDSRESMRGQLHLEDLLDTEQVVSALILPLGMNDEIVGVLSLGTSRSQAFSRQDFSLLWSVSDQISVALTRIHLAKNQQRLATVIDQVTDAVVITDIEGNIIYVNPAFQQMSGYSQAEVLGQNPRILKSGKHDPAIYTQLWVAITGGEIWRGRLTNKKKSGEFYTCDIIITPLYNEYGDIINFVAVGRDVTQTLQLEEQYRQAQKMESVGQLAGGVAHDFNNILTAIMGYTGLSMRSLPHDSPLRANLQGIETSAERAANLTRQLLAFARKQVIEPKLVNLNELIAGASKILRRLITEDIKMVILPATGLAWVKADPGQLEQVLFNLVVNARDAMPGGGKLILETANVTLEKGEAHPYGEVTPGHYVMVTVTDTGMGMNDEVKARIFEPFFTTKGPGKGTGLGLATCFGIIKQSDGHIRVDSVLNEGTTFRILLPRAAETTGLSPIRNRAAPLPRGAETILLVEDEQLARDTSAQTLRELGYTVLEAENGEEALREIDNLGGKKLHLLITDLVMPQLGGRALVEKIKPVYPNLKILLMSGYNEAILSQRYRPEAGIVFLQKPFSGAIIARKVRELLDCGDR